VILTESGDVGDDAEVVSGVRGVTELLEVSSSADEHVVEPRGKCDRDKTSYGGGVDWLTVGAFSWLLVPREPMNASGVASVEADKAGADQVAILSDVKAGDEIVIVDITLGWRVPSFSDLTQVLFEVGDDVLETSNLGGVLGGTGLDRKGEAMDELTELLSRDVGVRVEGGEH